MKHKTIVLCGGHLAPALAVIEDIKDLYPGWRVVYFGRTHPLENDPSISLESRTIQSLGIPFISITTGRFQRHAPISGARSLSKVPIGVAQSLWHLLRLRPDVIVGFGGYLSAAVCFSGWLLRIPILIHEQTRIFGLANRWVSRFASTVCISFPDTEGVPSFVRPVVTGNPTCRSFNETIPYEPFGDSSLPLIYITGGSLGSHALNVLVMPIISDLARHFRLLHQSGEANNKEDYHRLQHLKSTMSSRWKENYHVVSSIDHRQVGTIMKQASLIVSRAGANTACEIAATGTPAILIPLPWSADKEQQKNAQLLTDAGLAVSINQNEATPVSLAGTIQEMHAKRETYRRTAARARSAFPTDTTGRIVHLIGGLAEQ